MLSTIIGQATASAVRFAFKNYSHVLYNTHIIRELQGLIENGSGWTIEMKTILIELYITTDYGKGTITELTLYLLRFNKIHQLAE